MKCACRNCKDREVGCHSTCEKYIEYKKTLDELKPKPARPMFGLGNENPLTRKFYGREYRRTW